MIQKLEDINDADERVIDYSDPAQEPHEPARRSHKNDSGGFVAAGIAVAMVIVGGFVYAGYLTENITIQPRHNEEARVTSPVSPEKSSQMDTDQAR